MMKKYFLAKLLILPNKKFKVNSLFEGIYRGRFLFVDKNKYESFYEKSEIEVSKISTNSNASVSVYPQKLIDSDSGWVEVNGEFNSLYNYNEKGNVFLIIDGLKVIGKGEILQVIDELGIEFTFDKEANRKKIDKLFELYGDKITKIPFSKDEQKFWDKNVDDNKKEH